MENENKSNKKKLKIAIIIGAILIVVPTIITIILTFFSWFVLHYLF